MRATTPSPAKPTRLKGSRKVESTFAKTVFVVRSELLPYSETFVKEQVLAYSRWRPILVGLRRTQGLPVDDIEVRLLPPARSIAAWAYRTVLSTLEVTPADIRRRLGPESASLVHVHFGTDAVENWSWIKTLRIPVIVTLHGYDININPQWWRSGSRSRLQRRYPAMLLSIAANPRVHFLAVSNAVRSRAIAWGIPADRVSVRHIGVNANLFQNGGPPMDQRLPRILFVGGLVEKKGAEYLIRAFARIRRHIKHAELILVGDGPLRRRLQRLASELQVPVKFAGILSSEAIRELMHIARVVCLPSITAANGDAEGFGMVILEAQACGVPVITSARGGAEEGIIHGVTGFRFEEKDVQTLAEYLLRLLQDDALASAMSVEARRNIERNFELTGCTASLERLYDSWAAGTRPHDEPVA